MKILLSLIVAGLMGCFPHYERDAWCNSSHWRNCRQMHVSPDKPCKTQPEVQPKDGPLVCSHPNHKMIDARMFESDPDLAVLLCYCKENL